jgi:hypothetical protein
LKKLDSAKEIEGFSLGFLPPGLDFLPKNLDFLPGDLDLLHRAGDAF